MNIGKTILNIRKERKVSQEEFGKLFHVTRQTVSNWENEKSYPDLQTLIDMSDMFEISLDRLLKEDVQMVKTIDREKKYAKAGKVVITIVSVILVVGLLYGIVWNVKKANYEKAFQTAIKKYEFTQDSNGVNSYSKRTGNIVYTVYGNAFREISKFSFKLSDFDKFISATCEKNGNTVDLRVDAKQNVVAFYTNGTDTFDQDNLLRETLIGDDGVMNISDDDSELAKIYNDMNSEIKTAINECKKMYSDFYKK